MIQMNWSVPSTVQPPSTSNPWLSRSGTIFDRHSLTHSCISPGLTVYSRICNIATCFLPLQPAPNRLGAGPNTELVDVLEEVFRILVHTIRAGRFELLSPVPAGEAADPQSVRTLRGQLIPHAVADDKALPDLLPELIRRGNEKVGVGLGELDPVARDHRHAIRDLQQGEGCLCGRLAAAGGDRPRHAGTREKVEQVLRPRERPHLPDAPRVPPLVERAQVVGLF